VWKVTAEDRDCGLAHGKEIFPKARVEVVYPLIVHIFFGVLDTLTGHAVSVTYLELHYRAVLKNQIITFSLHILPNYIVYRNTGPFITNSLFYNVEYI
jgi:hypothetical protein